MPSTPYVVQGTIYTSRGTVPNSIVTINSDISTTTDDEGKYVLDLANLSGGYTAGSDYTIEAKDEFNNEYTSSTITASGGGQTKNLTLECRDRKTEQGYISGRVIPIILRGVGDKPNTVSNLVPIKTYEAQLTRLVSGATYPKYIGEAAPGTSSSSAKWRIKYVKSNGEVKWANGNSEFNKVWSSRTSYSYS